MSTSNGIFNNVGAGVNKECVVVTSGPGDAGKVVALNSEGKIDHENIVNRYPDDAAATGAGLDAVGCTYFNTTDDCQYIYVADVCDGNPGFVKIHNGDVCTIVRNASGQVIPHSVVEDVIHDQVDVDSCNAYNPATGVWTASKPGLYMIIYSIGLLQTGAIESLLSPTLRISGSYNTVFRGSQYNADHFTTSLSSGNANAMVHLQTGDTVTSEVFQTNNAAIALPSFSIFDTYMMIARVA
jgi:hypothetical protein